MSRQNTLRQLEELFDASEVTDGFSSQFACVSWANRVAPLLRFNQHYHQTFMRYSQIINQNISVYTAEPAFRSMVSQVEMAIHELRADIANEEYEPLQASKPQNKPGIIDLKPNFYGIGVNLNEGWRRIKSLFNRSGSK